MKNELSVLFVTTNLNYNGAKKYIVEVTNELVRRGHRVGLIYAKGPLEDKIDERVQRYQINLRGLGLDPISRIRIILKAALVARKYKYKIIHSEASSSLLSHKMLSFFSKAKIVETIHQVWSKPNDRKKAAKRLPGRADILVSISPGVSAVMKKEGLDLGKVRVIQNGINTKEFEKTDQRKNKILKSSLGIGDKDPILIWVARISREKSPESFINWFPYILADFPNARLIMVGDNGLGDRTYLDYLIDKIKHLGLSKHIICVGGQTDVQKYLAIGDVFTITGRARDLAVMEAMAAGLPVVTSKLGYPFNPELVVNGETGYLINWSDWQGWANHIKFLLSQPNTAKKFGSAGKERIQKFFTIQRHVNDLERIYEDVLMT